jgi:hypothetical protein
LKKKQLKLPQSNLRDNFIFSATKNEQKVQGKLFKEINEGNKFLISYLMVFLVIVAMIIILADLYFKKSENQQRDKIDNEPYNNNYVLLDNEEENVELGIKDI